MTISVWIRDWQPAEARPFTDLPTAYKIACKRGPKCSSILENNQLNHYRNLSGGVKCQIYRGEKSVECSRGKTDRDTPICSSHKAIETCLNILGE